MNVSDLGEEPIVSELWSIDSERGHVRSPGAHIGTIIQAELEEQGKKLSNDTFTDQDLEAYRAMGFLWERIITDAVRRVYAPQHTLIKAEELLVDGIYLTPDFLLLSQDGCSVEEYKATFKSAKWPVESNQHWMSAIQCYCRAVGTCTANLRVLHIRGYINPPIPKLKQYRLTFEPYELEETWQRLTNFAKAKGWIK